MLPLGSGKGMASDPGIRNGRPPSPVLRGCDFRRQRGRKRTIVADGAAQVVAVEGSGMCQGRQQAPDHPTVCRATLRMRSQVKAVWATRRAPSFPVPASRIPLDFLAPSGRWCYNERQRGHPAPNDQEEGNRCENRTE